MFSVAQFTVLRPFSPSAILSTFLKINFHNPIPKVDPYKRKANEKERVRKMLSTWSATKGWGKKFVEKLAAPAPTQAPAPTTQAPPPPTAVAPPPPTSLALAAMPQSTALVPASTALALAPLASKDAARSILSRRVRQRTECKECKYAYENEDERLAFANNKGRKVVLGCKLHDHSVGMSDLVTMLRESDVYPKGCADRNIYPDVKDLMSELCGGLTPLGNEDSKQKYQVTLVKDGKNANVKGEKNCRFPGVKIVDDSMGAGSSASPAKRSIDHVSGETSSAKIAKCAANDSGDDGIFVDDNDDGIFVDE